MAAANEHTANAAGVKSSQSDTDDICTGTKAALVAAGIAKEEWFPTVPLPGMRGRGTRRKFQIVEDGRIILLTDLARGKGLWEVRLPVSAEEESRREQISKAKYEAWLAQQRELAERPSGLIPSLEAKDFPEALERLLRTLPPFIPGSISEGEAYLVRLTRALNDRSWHVVVGFAERLAARKAPAARPGLRLVIDNRPAE